jgi:hypothetical protein
VTCGHGGKKSCGKYFLGSPFAALRLFRLRFFELISERCTRRLLAFVIPAASITLADPLMSLVVRKLIL